MSARELINPNYLGARADRDRLVRALRLAPEAFASRAAVAIGAAP